jgi:hypothetical protein
VHKSWETEFPRGLKQAVSPKDVCSKKRRGIFNAAIYMRLRREIHQGIDALPEDVSNGSSVSDVAAKERIPMIAGNVREAFRVARIR